MTPIISMILFFFFFAIYSHLSRCTVFSRMPFVEQRKEKCHQITFWHYHLWVSDLSVDLVFMIFFFFFLKKTYTIIVNKELNVFVHLLLCKSFSDCYPTLIPSLLLECLWFQQSVKCNVMSMIF